MTIVLGISSTTHDTSAALFVNGKLVAAISEERLSRIKGDGKGLPQRSIDCVLRLAGFRRRDVDGIGLMMGFVPERYIAYPDKLKDMRRTVSRGWRQVRGKPAKLTELSSLLPLLAGGANDIEAALRKDVFLAQEGFRADAEVRIYAHHRVHAALAGYYSGASECAVVTVDGVGDRDESHASWHYAQGKLDCLHESTGLDNSAGLFYEAITKQLGFRPLRHEGKVLGLAAFGNPDVLYNDFRRALYLSADGLALKSDFDVGGSGRGTRYDYLKGFVDTHTREEVAAAAQKVLEDAVVPLVSKVLARTGQNRVALNGGVFANVKLNQRIAALPGVESVFVFPAMSDTGNSVGAALLLASQYQPALLADHPPLRDVYLGPGYSDAEIHTELARAGLAGECLSPDDLVERTAQAIHDGIVVGWFQGRMEFGPRALGNRSMIARPTDAAINKSLNDRLERTEFMPFAPSVLAEAADDIFFGVSNVSHTAEFMTITLDVKPEWRSRIPAVVHVDGTARPQLVRPDRNPLYHRVIARYHKLSGIPLVLNTSFNAHEEPIVCSPAEAIRALVDDRIDALAIGSFWVANPKTATAKS
ncbi:MAG: carbamoyltransferase [Rhodocyclales bacterium]|nr:carbamoyltransferase [Rhodocyclales bacterium]